MFLFLRAVGLRVRIVAMVMISKNPATGISACSACSTCDGATEAKAEGRRITIVPDESWIRLDHYTHCHSGDGAVSEAATSTEDPKAPGVLGTIQDLCQLDRHMMKLSDVMRWDGGASCHVEVRKDFDINR